MLQKINKNVKECVYYYKFQKKLFIKVHYNYATIIK